MRGRSMDARSIENIKTFFVAKLFEKAHHPSKRVFVMQIMAKMLKATTTQAQATEEPKPS